MAKIKTIDIVDVENVRNEKLRYQKNSLAYMLGLLGICFSILNAFLALNTYYLGVLTIVKILMNIVIFLFGFLSCEKVKAYNKNYAYVFFGFAGISVLRIFWVPLLTIVNWKKYKNGNNDGSMFYEQMLNPDKQKKGYLISDGTLRGTLCIILLLCSAIAFAFAGYVGYHKARRLEKYLESINVDFHKR